MVPNGTLLIGGDKYYHKDISHQSDLGITGKAILKKTGRYLDFYRLCK